MQSLRRPILGLAVTTFLAAFASDARADGPSADEIAKKTLEHDTFGFEGTQIKARLILTEADGMCLANLCQAWSTLIQAQTKLTEMGILYRSPSGFIMQSPLLAIINHCVDTITRLSREFGLTPASRVRLTVIDGPEPGRPERMSSLEEILSMPMRERPKPPFVQ